MATTVSLVDSILRNEIIVVIDEDSTFIKQLSYQPSSKKFTVFIFNKDTKEDITKRFDYVHTAVDFFNKETY